MPLRRRLQLAVQLAGRKLRKNLIATVSVLQNLGTETHLFKALRTSSDVIFQENWNFQNHMNRDGT